MTDTTARPKIYADEFRRAAVDLIIAEKLTVAEAARRLGVHPEVLRKWKGRLAPVTPAAGDTATPTWRPRTAGCGSRSANSPWTARF